MRLPGKATAIEGTNTYFLASGAKWGMNCCPDCGNAVIAAYTGCPPSSSPVEMQGLFLPFLANSPLAAGSQIRRMDGIPLASRCCISSNSRSRMVVRIAFR